jgi:Transglutaminase-like superfamily
MRLIITCISLLLFFTISANAQDTAMIIDGLNRTVYSIDPEAEAVVLSERKEAHIETRDNKYYEITATQKCIKILKKDAVVLGNLQIRFSSSDLDFILNGIKGWSYNLVDGLLDSLKRADIHTRKMDDDMYEADFSIPNVRPGSILFYIYANAGRMTQNVSQWVIQDKYPKLLTEYWVTYPIQLPIRTTTYGLPELSEHKTEEASLKSRKLFGHVGNFEMTGSGAKVSSLYIRKNVAAIKPEVFVNNLSNHVEYMDVTVNGKLTRHGIVYKTDTWELLNKELVKDPEFGGQLNGKNKFLHERVAALTDTIAKEYDKVRTLFVFVRDNVISANERNFELSTDIKEVFNKLKGDAVDKNMLLTAMLKNAGIEAYPLLLTTTNNLSAYESVPVLGRFNYLACVARVNGKNILLDASDKINAFGALPYYCYNGYARIVNDTGSSLELTPDMISDRTDVTIRIDSIRDSVAKIDVFVKMGVLGSYTLRAAIKHDPSSKQYVLDGKAADMNANITIVAKSMVNEDKPDANIILHFSGSFTLAQNASELLFNSSLIELFKDNPFSAVKRVYPIEFPFLTEYNSYVSVFLPQKYKVQNLPPQLFLKLDSAGAMTFEEYAIHNDGLNLLSVNTKMKISGAWYPTESYEAIRSFFAMMLKSKNDIIVINK